MERNLIPFQLQVESHRDPAALGPSVVSSPLYMFADDTKVFCVIRSSENYSALQHDFYRTVQ